MAPRKDAAAWTKARRRARSTVRPFDRSWLRDGQDVRAVLDGCWFDAAAGQHVIDFFRDFLCHSKGQWSGQPFILLPWQEDATRRLFGWRRADGTRRYRRAAIFCPKKNGKSTWLAGLELYLLVADLEPGAEIYCVAVDRDNASIVFDEAASMVRRSPDLSARLDINDTHKQISYPEQAAKFRALSAEVSKQEGLNIHGLCFDELHAQKSRAMWDTLQYGGAARRQPLMISISTAGLYDPTSIGWDVYEQAAQVLDGTREDWAFFALIYAAAPEDVWTDPAVWARVNPSWGVTINPQTFAEECRAAQHSPAQENTFKRYRLNIWTQQIERWLPLATWDASAGHAIDEAAYTGRQFYGGLDLASVSDLSAAALLFPCPHDPDAVDVLVRCWLPEATLRTAPQAPLYEQWRRSGHLASTPGPMTDYGFLRAQLLADAARFGCHSLAIDRLFQGLQLSQQLAEEGLQVFPCGMGFLSMAPLVSELERLVLGGKFHHGGHPILRSAVDHVEMVLDPAGNRKPSRENRSKKIDALVACLLALDRWLRRDPTPAASVYMARGIRTLGDTRPAWE